MLNVKPSSAPRARIIARLAADCAAVEPYFSVICSPRFCPPAGKLGLSSNGWKVMSASTASAALASACSSPHRPMTHHGHATSETKSIFRCWVMARLVVVLGKLKVTESLRYHSVETRPGMNLQGARSLSRDPYGGFAPPDARPRL